MFTMESMPKEIFPFTAYRTVYRRGTHLTLAKIKHKLLLLVTAVYYTLLLMHQGRLSCYNVMILNKSRITKIQKHK